MIIGMSYDLKDDYIAKGFTPEQVAEMDCEETIGAIESVITAKGHKAVRIGSLQDVMAALLKGERWDMVFNISEGLFGSCREAQIPALLDAYKIPYTFSDSGILALALNKALTCGVLKSYGIKTADSFVVKTLSDTAKITLPFPLFAKPVAEGTSKGITPLSVIRNKDGLDNVCKQLLSQFKQPVLVETFLSGREFTVGMLGNAENAKVLGVMEVVLLADADKEGYTYENKQKYTSRVKYVLADEPAVAALAKSAWAALGCLDAGRIDIRMDKDGKPVFMEVNPLAGLNPSYSDLCIIAKLVGFPYAELIGSIIDSCSKRNGLQ